MTHASGFLETNGARIYYEVDGEGAPVVLIHAGIANLRMWDEQVPALSDAYRVIRYDTRGFGLTETDAVPFSNRADIAALLDHLSESSAHVVGISRAGQIALDFALEFPDRVRSLVVANGGVSGYDAPGGDPAAWEEPEKWEATGDWEPLAAWEADFWVNGEGQPAYRADRAIRDRVHEWILTNYLAEKTDAEPQVLVPPAAGRLSELRVPLLVIIGSVDEASTQASCRFLAESVPDARLEVFEGAAHMVNMEQPERFNRLLRDFLEQSSQASVAGAESAHHG